jgi:uncharacterized membrane protein YeaQ/YmgE (transglycosylase-associated protein family)
MDVMQTANYLNYILAWMGMGMVLGLIALIVMPSPDGRGALATVLMATAGTLLGCLMLQYLTLQEQWVLPISLHGVTVGLGGAIVSLIFFRVLGGHWLSELESDLFRYNRRRRRRYLVSEEEETTPARRRPELK